ncbi:MAG: 3',5'-cyclic adenosine monophosphate phosphodiesterase CpdA [Candidatus Erwinia impunctatus]|nr:3',5'-cyclic adenosine monophosphate phosphodiesterase CpdA [Culicoides impunctatus]
MAYSPFSPTPLSSLQQHSLGAVWQLYQVPKPNPVTDGVVRFGIMADPQYADSDTANNRFYRQSLDKLSSAISQLNEQPLSFVVTVGDFVDQYWQSFTPLLHCYEKLRHPHASVIGNHDADVISQHLAASALPLPKHYYAFSVTGYRFVVIDGNDISLYCNAANGSDRTEAEKMLSVLQAAEKCHAQPWNGAVGETQLSWLEQQLIDAKAQQECVIVFGHYPLTPENKHNLWNCEQIVSLLCRYQVRAYFAGHDHQGGHARVQSTDFITLQGMVEGDAIQPVFATVELNSNRLQLTGFGNENSYLL